MGEVEIVNKERSGVKASEEYVSKFETGIIKPWLV